MSLMSQMASAKPNKKTQEQEWGIVIKAQGVPMCVQKHNSDNGDDSSNKLPIRRRLALDFLLATILAKRTYNILFNRGNASETGIIHSQLAS